ncbi:MAG: hypothetical protein IJV44_02035 [Prevotella sp.]|nr:hypothetical protein [Prevotella sp.]
MSKTTSSQLKSLNYTKIPADLESATLSTGVSRPVDWSQQTCRLESTTD